MDVVFKYRIPLLLAIVKFLLPFFLQHNAYELQRDEYLYLQQGHHLAWGYMEVPPLLSVFAWISQLFGQPFFMVKLWPSLFGACTLFVACLMTMEMGGKQFALFITGLSIAESGLEKQVHVIVRIDVSAGTVRESPFAKMRGRFDPIIGNRTYTKGPSDLLKIALPVQ